MTPKEKANEIFDNFYLMDKIEPTLNFNQAKQCALIAVNLRLDGDFVFTSIEYGIDSLEYWQEVKKEIEKL